MATGVLNIITAAFPTISGNLRYVVYKSAEYPAELASQTFSAPHAERTVTFTGLEAPQNFIWKLLQGTQQLASFNFVTKPDVNVSYKAPVEIEVGVTPGFTADTTTAVLDGTSGTDDWRGYELRLERIGQGTVTRDVSVRYTWDSATGTITLTEPDVKFQAGEFFNAEFDLIVSPTGGGVSAQDLFTNTVVVTGNTTLTADDIGKNVIIQGAGDYLEVTLPDISLVTGSKLIYFESGRGSHKCCKIKTVSGQLIDWLSPLGDRVKINMGQSELIALYRQKDTTVWRVMHPYGNYSTVGSLVYSDLSESSMLNALLCDGRSVSVNAYARLYEEHVLQLDPSQVCAYSAHGTGDNNKKFSFSSGGFFRIPDLRNLFLRNSNGTNKPGDYQVDAVYIAPAAPNAGGIYGVKQDGTKTATSVDNSSGEINIRDAVTIQSVAGVTETRPKGRITRVYVLV